MLLSIYTSDEKGEIKAVPSIYDAAPLFYINMPDSEKAPVFDFKNFPFEIFKGAPLRYKRGKTIDKVGYYDLACSFDIETTTIKDAEKPFAFMYQWQYCIEDYVFMGKTWQEFKEFNNILTSVLDLNIFQHDGELLGRSLVCYIFNLSFEFTFMYAFLGELVSPLFTDVYSPLIVPTKAGITYRCAYRLTNKSLEVFTKGFKHAKLAGDLDYNIIRTPIYNDPKNGLTDLELAYCYNDVKGLSEALRDRFIKDPKYNIATIPLTSTGYVRKDCRNSMRKDPKCKAKFQELRLSPHLYLLCRAAFRGGNTHGNHHFIGKTIGINNYGLVKHWDITSSYPAQMMKRIFPRTPFEEVKDTTNLMQNLDKLSSAYCFLIKFKIYDLEYIGSCGVPYISKAKSFTRTMDKDIIKEDNGRIFSAPVVMVTMTEIDALITMKEYKYSKIEVIEAYRSRKGFLPYELRRVVMEYYKRKTELKGCTDPMDLYEYAKAKELLNAIYGLMCMRIDRLEFTFNNGEYIPKQKPLTEALEEFYTSDSSFLPYQYSIYITSAARASLYEGCCIVGKDLLYIDTDSVFYIGEHEKEFEALNARIEKEALKHNAVAYNKKGDAFPLGVWTQEEKNGIKFFRTLGAKKYLLSEDGETISSTISGVSKKIGKEFFTEHGFDAFTDQTVIPVSGKVTAHYNREEPHIITINGVDILTASNIALVNASYTFKIKNDFKQFLDYISSSLKNCHK